MHEFTTSRAVTSLCQTVNCDAAARAQASVIAPRNIGALTVHYIANDHPNLVYTSLRI